MSGSDIGLWVHPLRISDHRQFVYCQVHSQVDVVLVSKLDWTMHNPLWEIINRRLALQIMRQCWGRDV